MKTDNVSEFGQILKVITLMIIFVPLQKTRNVVFCSPVSFSKFDTKRGKSQSQNLTPLSKVAVLVSTLETELTKSQSKCKKSGLTHPCCGCSSAKLTFGKMEACTSLFKRLIKIFKYYLQDKAELGKNLLADQQLYKVKW